MKYFYKFFIVLLFILGCSTNDKPDNVVPNNTHKTFSGHIIDTITYRYYDSLGSLYSLEIKGMKDSVIDNTHIIDLKNTKELWLSYVNTSNNWESYLNPDLKRLNIFMSKSYIDSLLVIDKSLNDLEFLRISAVDFDTRITDSLPNLRCLILSEDNNTSIYSNINSKLFPKLETLVVDCKYCDIDLPTKSLNRLHIKTNLIDTSYQKQAD